MPLKSLLSNATGSSRKAAQSGMSDEEKLAMLAELEESGLGWFWSTDTNGQIVYLSDAFAQQLGLESADYIGRPLQEVFTPCEDIGSTPSIALKLSARKPFSALNVQASAGGSDAVVALSGRAIRSRSGKFSGFRGNASDITEAHHREEETERLAKYDSLTGLANRHQMAQTIDAMLSAFRAAKRNCAVMMMDLDRFKQVNDTLGHAAGDELLKEVTARLSRIADGEFELGRLGGDEFQILIPDKDDRGELGEIARKIISILSQPYSLEDGRCVIGASVGIAIAPYDGVSRDEIVRAADMALYSAKNSGRGQFRFYSGDLANEALFRRRLEDDLAQAVHADQLLHHYQPVVRIADSAVQMLEAQICWQHPQRGLIDHEECASILKGSAFASQAGLWAIGKACADAKQWPDALGVLVKVNQKLFDTEDFVQQIAQKLDDNDIDPSRLELAICESIFDGDETAVDKTLHALFKLGVKLTLDEFGSGHSSFGYLRRAPFESVRLSPEIHLDQSGSDNCDQPLIAAIVALAGALDMQVCASEVETVEQYRVLQECGVARVQGAVFADSLTFQQVADELVAESWTIDPVTSRNTRAKRRTVYRKIQVIHDDHSYDVTLRNLSRTGALIEGLMDIPLETQFVVDLGGGQLAVATVVRTAGDTQGLEFEMPLVDDGAGGLCTRIRVSPYALSEAGAPLEALSSGDYKGMKGGMLDPNKSVPKFGYASGRAA